MSWSTRATTAPTTIHPKPNLNPMRLIQHKREAYWFYSFLSNFYDKLVNPLFWTERMRDESLVLARLDEDDLSVIDVGAGTGFTTEGIVRHVPAGKVVCLDQSPHQLAHARKKPSLHDCTFLLGDAEQIPYGSHQFDRYVSAGSIEYWPNPQRGIDEAYRVLKPGGRALLIGPLEPETGFARWLANLWMLFPKEEAYFEWFRRAGFEDIEVTYIRPHWIRHDRYGIAIAGTKPAHGQQQERPAVEAEAEDAPVGVFRDLLLVARLLVGSLAGFVFIPIALWGYIRSGLRAEGEQPTLNVYQLAFLIGLALLLGWVLWFLLGQLVF